jgi:hypothetical protein
VIGHLNGTGNKVQGRDDTAGKGNRDNGAERTGKPAPKAKPKAVPAVKIIGKIKGLKGG